MKLNNAREVSDYLRTRRRDQKRTQADLAQSIGVYQPTISSFEHESGQSRLDTLFKLTNELGLEVHFIEKRENN